MPEHILDARGLKCPLPVLKMEKRLSEIAPGDTLVVRATDPIAKIDVPLYCRQQGFSCQTEALDGELHFTIRKS